MIRVEQADEIIQSRIKKFGKETIPLQESLGRVLAENIYADRDLPPFNRATMDGIAITINAYQRGIRTYRITSIQAAGQVPMAITAENECIEIMTGGALSDTVNTVIRYEYLEIKDRLATVVSGSPNKGQNIHKKGLDRKKGERILSSYSLITPTSIGICASVGKTAVAVKKLPRIIIVTTGDELVEANEAPLAYQLRLSNNVTIHAVLQKYRLQPDMLHLKDNPPLIRQKLTTFLQRYDVILLTGGVSMGKFDYIPQILRDLSVKQEFHTVQQRPGKPFWFGTHRGGSRVFAFPGNPVSTFLCLYRYFLPWLEASLGISSQRYLSALLNKNVTFDVPLQYFMPVKLWIDKQGQLIADPLEGNGSGDFSNLATANAFMELPLEQNEFKKGESYKVWPYSEFERVW